MSIKDNKPALTTTFTPSPYCTEHIYAPSFYHLGPTYGDKNCMPSDWEPVSTFYYSPGICPEGYTQACGTTVTIGDKKEARATCCPSGYSCNRDTYMAWFLTEFCQISLTSGQSTFTYTVTGDDGAWEARTTDGDDRIHAYGIEIRWNPAAETQSVTSTGTATERERATSTFTDKATSTAMNKSTATDVDKAASTETEKSNEPNFGVGFGAGIAVGIVVALLATAGLFFFRRLRRRPAQQPLLQHAAPLDTIHIQKSAPLTELPDTYRAAELPAKPHSVQFHHGQQYPAYL